MGLNPSSPLSLTTMSGSLRALLSPPLSYYGCCIYLKRCAAVGPLIREWRSVDLSFQLWLHTSDRLPGALSSSPTVRPHALTHTRTRLDPPPRAGRLRPALTLEMRRRVNSRSIMLQYRASAIAACRRRNADIERSMSRSQLHRVYFKRGVQPKFGVQNEKCGVQD